MGILFVASMGFLYMASIGMRRFSRNQARPRRHGATPRLEALEERVLLTTVNWTNPASGDWLTKSNWSTGTLPQPGDDVVINKVGAVQITLIGSTTVNSLSITGDALTVSSGTLTVTGAVTNTGGAITVSPGTMLDVGGQYTQNAAGRLSLLPGSVATGVGTNLLANSDFESPTATNTTTAPTGWQTWANSYVSTQFAQAGTQSLQEYGGNSGVQQSFPATPGISYTGSADAMTPSTDPLTGPEGAFLAVHFFDSNGVMLNNYSPPNSITVLSSTSATGGPIAGTVGNQGWNHFTTTAVAPANTASVRFVLNVGAYTGNPGTAGGTVYWDKTEFGPTALNTAKVTVASLINSGKITVGAGDSVTTRSAFTQTATGILDIQLAGPPAGNLFGNVFVGGAATLGGTLQAELVNGYIPSINDEFSVLTFVATTGAFATYQLPSGNNFTFVAGVNPTYLGLAAVPTSVTTQINAGTVVQSISPNMLGVNLAYWDSKLTTTQTQQLVHAAGLGSFRFPGGSSSDDYHFNVANNYNDSAANTVPQFVQFIQAVSGSGVVTLDYGSGSPQEAAAELAYLQGSPTDATVIGTGIEWNDGAGQWQNVNWQTVGYWASLRSAAPLATNDGQNFLRLNHTATFSGIKFWEVGNEEYGNWEIDHHGTAGPGGVSTGAQHDPATYAAFAHTFATFAAKISSSISIGIDSGDPTSSWTKDILTAGSALGFVPGFISDHSYMQGPGAESDSNLLLNTVSNPASILNWSTRHTDYKSLLQQTLGNSGSSVQIMATEFNSVYTNPGKQSTSLVNGLFVADSIGGLLNSGYTGGYVWDLRNGWDTGQNNSDTLYGWRKGGDYGLLGDPNTNLPPSTGPYVAYPSYYAEQLASKIVQSGAQVVSAISNYNGLAVYAVKEPNGHLEILAINKNPDAALTDQFSLTGFQASGAAQVWQYGQVQDHAQSLTTDGSSALSVTSTTLPISNSTFKYSFPAYSMTVIDLAPTINKLVFTQAPPTSGTAGTALNATIKVSIETPGGSVVTSDNSKVTLTVGTSTYTATASNGVATFNISNLIFTKSGTYTWTASDGILTMAGSSLIISPAKAAKVVITQAPTTGTAGAVLSVALKASIEDQYGNIVTAASSVTLTLATGQFSNGLTTATIATVAGVATFSGLIINTAGVYTLKATDGLLTSALTGNITINPAPASKLVFTAVPGTGSLLTGLASAVTVTIEDAYGNIVISNSTAVVLALVSAPAGGALSVGTSITVNAVKGVATFAALKFTKAGTYMLKVTDGSLTAAVSTKIVIS